MFLQIGSERRRSTTRGADDEDETGKLGDPHGAALG
jgi:hypothetical protein